MGFKSLVIRPFASKIVSKEKKRFDNALEEQNLCFINLIQNGKSTVFGADHHFSDIRNYHDFKLRVPVRGYEAFRPYIERILTAEKNILWPGKPRYLAKTSGTTSGVKYIPISDDSIGHHIDSARNLLFYHFMNSGNGSFFDAQMLYLSGSPILKETGGIPTGRLSGIVNHEIPGWIKGNKLPTEHVNEIEDWENKVQLIIEESCHKDVRLIGGIPPWVQMYFELLLDKTKKTTVKDVFPNLSVFVYGGVNYEPYRSSIERLIGEKINSLETYPASEGFIAYQDQRPSDGLILNTHAGLFFEFIRLDEIHQEHPARIDLSQVQTGVNYVLIISSNAGLWAYNIGDTIEFVSKDPYRIKVTGRVKHFISAFGEHVISKEVEKAMENACAKHGVEVTEFTVAPMVNPPDQSLPFHEWFIEFSKVPVDMETFKNTLDKEMVAQNIYYEDLIIGKILQPLKIKQLRKNAFREYMQSIGKLGGQNKVARLSNDRKIADQLSPYLIKK